jgi:hypothetical protein
MALFSHHLEHRLRRIYDPWIATNLFKEHECYTLRWCFSCLS